MGGISLNLVVLRTADSERAEQFYKCLGLSFERHQHGNGPPHLAAEIEGGVFELYLIDERHPSTTGTRVGFTVPSVDGALAALAGYPSAIVSPAKDSPWGRRAVVKDPDGHRVELVEAKSDGR